MFIRRWSYLIITAVAMALLVNCATAPETGRRQLLLIDTRQETEIGLKAFSQIKNETPVSRRSRDAQRVRTVGRRIASVVAMPQAEWEFVLFEDDTPNAFALPGGKVGVNTGILPLTRDDAGLATVIGHEIAHVMARHGAERMSQQVAIDLGGRALSAALGSDAGIYGDLAVKAYGVGATLGVVLPYSRTQELEADHLGLLYMARAGYDPRAAVEFWRRFKAYSDERGGGNVEFLSTHPLDTKRITQIEMLLPEARAEYLRVAGG